MSGHYQNPFAQYYTAPPISYGADGVPIVNAGGQVAYWKGLTVIQPTQGIRPKRPSYYATGGVKPIPTIELPGKGSVVFQPPQELPSVPAPKPTDPKPASGESFDVMGWAKENPLIVAGIAAAAFFMFKGK